MDFGGFWMDVCGFSLILMDFGGFLQNLQQKQQNQQIEREGDRGSRNRRFLNLKSAEYIWGN